MLSQIYSIVNPIPTTVFHFYRPLFQNKQNYRSTYPVSWRLCVVIVVGVVHTVGGVLSGSSVFGPTWIAATHLPFALNGQLEAGLYQQGASLKTWKSSHLERVAPWHAHSYRVAQVERNERKLLPFVRSVLLYGQPAIQLESPNSCPLAAPRTIELSQCLSHILFKVAGQFVVD